MLFKSHQIGIETYFLSCFCPAKQVFKSHQIGIETLLKKATIFNQSGTLNRTKLELKPPQNGSFR